MGNSFAYWYWDSGAPQKPTRATYGSVLIDASLVPERGVKRDNQGTDRDCIVYAVDPACIARDPEAL